MYATTLSNTRKTALSASFIQMILAARKAEAGGVIGKGDLYEIAT
jgi:hypothetical protein